MSQDREDSKPAVCAVLGMHRSGTSAIARALPLLGFSLGDDLAGAAPDNPKGFWEDRRVMEVNEALFNSLGLGWDCIQPIEMNRIRELARGDLGRMAKDLVRERLDELGSWGFKDPRTVRLLPFWQDALDDIGVSLLRLGVVRNPLSVADSLNRRNAMPQAQGLLLWMAYNRPLVGNYDALIDYDDLLASPAETLSMCAERMGVALSAGRDLDDYVDTFLSKDLRHAMHRRAELGGGMLLHTWALGLLDALRGKDVSLADFDARWVEISKLLELVDSAQLATDELQTLYRQAGGTKESASSAAELNADGNRTGNHTTMLKDLRQRWQERERRLSATKNDYRQLRLRLETCEKRKEELDQELGHATKRIGQLEHERTRAIREANFYLELYRRTPTARSNSLAKKLLKRMIAVGRRLPLPVKRVIRRIILLVPGGIGHRVFNRLAPQNSVDSASTPERMRRHKELLDMLRRAPSPKGDVFFFPVINWGFRTQRPQHLAKQLAQRGYRVFYFDTRFAPSQRDRTFTVTEAPDGNIFLVQLHSRTHGARIYSEVPNEAMAGELRAALYSIIEESGSLSRLAVVDLPFWHRVVKGMAGMPLVYDCMDYHAGFNTNSKEMLLEEEHLIRDSDSVIFTADRLREIAVRERGSVVIRNAAEVSHFSTAANGHQQNARPVIGYFGAISDWFDMSLVVELAKRHPEYDVVLIGSTVGCDDLPDDPPDNLVFRGEMEYGRLPEELARFNVCLIPFKRVELTMCTNPVKVYEYLSAGKPVVATRLPELELIPEGLVHLSDNVDEFIANVEIAVAENGDVELTDRRRAWAEGQDWNHRGADLERTVEMLFPKVSVIVLVYNNPELTRRCLESVDKYSHYPNLEIVVVDNASESETRDYVRQYAEGRDDVVLVLNDENLGFAGGNNSGLAVASGDFLIMLNNDTHVSDGWVHDLVRHFRQDASLGVVGPVTNNIGNEAKVDVSYHSMTEMICFARDRTARYAGERMYNDVVAFFCVMISRQAYEAVGGLDEDFGQGFFEDDDYCNRARKKGFRIAIADDVFVHHELSASFDALGQRRKQELFQRNKAIYESKWGPWKPHKYRGQS